MRTTIGRVTMLSFRVPDDEAAEVQRWANTLGVDRSDCVVNFDNVHTLPREFFRRRVAILSAPRMSQACRVLRNAVGC